MKTPFLAALVLLLLASCTSVVSQGKREPVAGSAAERSIPEFQNAARAAMATVLIAVPTDRAEEYVFGSGSIIAPSGLILTNYHVVRDKQNARPYNSLDSILVIANSSTDRPPDRAFRAQVVLLDQTLDLALLRLTAMDTGRPLPNPLSLPTVPLGDSDKVQIGDRIQVIGFPGLGGDTVTLTEGIVAGFQANRSWIKTDTEINPGNSGGMAINSAGELIGVPTGAVTDSDVTGKIGYLRPINAAKPLLDRAGLIAVPTAIAVLLPTSTISVPSPTSVPPPTRVTSPTRTPFPIRTSTPAAPVGAQRLDVLDGRERLGVFSPMTGRVQIIFEAPCAGTVDSAAWSRDGSKILITYQWECDKSNAGTAIRIMDADGTNGSNIVEIDDSRASFANAIWDLSGQRIAVFHHDIEGQFSPRILDLVDRSLQKPASCNGGGDLPRHWSTDGKWLILMVQLSPQRPPYNVPYACDVDGNARVTLESLGPTPMYDERYFPWQVTYEPCEYSDWACDMMQVPSRSAAQLQAPTRPPATSAPKNLCASYKLPSTEHILHWRPFQPPILGIIRPNGIKVYFDIADAEFWDPNEKGQRFDFNCPAEAEAQGFRAVHPK